MNARPSRAELPGRRVSYPARYLGALLEYTLFWLTLGIGWVVWFSVAARRGQTPAKQLMRIRIHDYKTGAVATQSQVYARELFGKIGVPILLMMFGFVVADTFFGFFVIVELLHWLGIAAIFFTRDRRALWDYHANTVVRQHSKDATVEAQAPRPAIVDFEAERRELERLWGGGTITSEEYSARLRDLRARETAQTTEELRPVDA